MPRPSMPPSPRSAGHLDVQEAGLSEQSLGQSLERIWWDRTQGFEQGLFPFGLVRGLEVLLVHFGLGRLALGRQLLAHSLSALMSDASSTDLPNSVIDNTPWVLLSTAPRFFRFVRAQARRYSISLLPASPWGTASCTSEKCSSSISLSTISWFEPEPPRALHGAQRNGRGPARSEAPVSWLRELDLEVPELRRA